MVPKLREFVRGHTGFDVVRAQPRLIDFLRDRGVETIIDVGANTGQFAIWLRRYGYVGNIISLEPVSTAFAELKKNAQRDKKWTVMNIGAGEKKKSVEINIFKNTVYSSIVESVDNSEIFNPGFSADATETISVETLDSLFADLSGQIFLKIDTQGYEAQVLAGAGEFLKRVCGVQLEAPCIHLYKNVWSLGDAINAMEGHGFKLCQATPVGYSPIDPVAALELDVIFGRPR